MTVLVAAWRQIDAAGAEFAAHLHGRELSVRRDALTGTWRWRVSTQGGSGLAAGMTSSRLAAQRAAEDDATAVHPPTDELLDRLLR
jgi:hypothetical protein